MTRDNDLQGKIFAVSGGASGIGLATSQILVRRGASVAIGDIDEIALASAKEHLASAEERVLFTKLDVGDRKSVDEWIASAVEKFGGLTGAANCAGVIGKHHGTRAVEELEDDQWDLIMRVNLTGWCCDAVLLGEGLLIVLWFRNDVLHAGSAEEYAYWTWQYCLR